MKQTTLEVQEELNDSLGIILSNNGINKLCLINIGNSIASGFSLRRLTKPLFLRDESLEKTLKKHGVDFKYHHFARAQNNNDEHLFEWLVCNIKESSIYSMNRNDYLSGKTSMNPTGISEDEVFDYFPDTR